MSGYYGHEPSGWGAYDDDRSDEPYLEAQCNECGTLWHAPDGDCPGCGAASYSFDARAAREYTAWADDQERRG